MDASSAGSIATLALQNAPGNKAEALSAGAGSKDAVERKRVAQEFSALLFHEVLKAMRAALPRDGLLESESLSRDIYTSMMDGEIARVMAKRDASGLTKTVEQSLDKMIAPQAQMPSKPQTPAPGVVSSVFGLRTDPFKGDKKFHTGVDIVAPAGAPIRAAAAGKVVFSGPVAGYGNLVEVDHGDGLVTRYGHNSANLVAVGEAIHAGQPIALVGNTGRSTGAHLHFEVRKDGKPVNPEMLLGELAKGARLSAVV